jgi:hypothetical protein
MMRDDPPCSGKPTWVVEETKDGVNADRSAVQGSSLQLSRRARSESVETKELALQPNSVA